MVGYENCFRFLMVVALCVYLIKLCLRHSASESERHLLLEQGMSHSFKGKFTGQLLTLGELLLALSPSVWEMFVLV